MNPKLKAWLGQPTTIHGIAVLIATGTGIGAYLATKNAVLAAGMGGSAFGVIAAAMGDNTANASGVEAIVGDVAKGIAARNLAAALPSIIADVNAALARPVPAPVVVVQAPPAAMPGLPPA